MEDGRRGSEGHMLRGPSQASHLAPSETQILEQRLLRGSQKLRVKGIKSLNNRFTDNTLTPSMTYLFTYYFNTLLNIFIN